MLRILCTGDSHTWGQGAKGLMEEMNPPCVAGELRLASFQTGGYVNRLRRLVNETTASQSREWRAQEISRFPGIEFAAPCAVVKEQSLEIRAEGALLRVELALTANESAAELTVDGREQRVLNLQTAEAENGYCLETFLLPEGEHTLSIRAVKGAVGVYRVESYAGSCAVVNGGVGSSAVKAFCERHWRERVEAVQPDVVLMEAHTINDWLTGESPEGYYLHLEEAIGRFQGLGSRVILMTVSPIAGAQQLPGLAAEYDEFVRASRRAAQDSGVLLCDANRMMRLMLEGMSEEQAERYLFADAWHVNDRGHAVYGQMLYETLCAAGILPR